MCICIYQCTSLCARIWEPEYFMCPRKASLNEPGTRLAVSKPQQSLSLAARPGVLYRSSGLELRSSHLCSKFSYPPRHLPSLGMAFNMGSGDQTRVLVLIRTITLACHYPSSAQQIKKLRNIPFPPLPCACNSLNKAKQNEKAKDH